ncbi:MAG TPA: hypothetical protein VGI74_07245 [Streptosporangiaceae bacterium]
MRVNQGGRTGRLMWMVPAAVLAALTSAGGAAAAPSAGVSARPAVADGTISTIAGGVGGPAKAAGVSLSSGTGNDGFFGPCGATVAGQNVYVADQDTVRTVNSLTGRLTTPVGDAVGSSPGDGAPDHPAFRAGTADGLPAADVAVSRTCVVAVGPHGTMAVDEGGYVYVVPGTPGSFFGQQMTAGDIYLVMGGGGGYGFPGTIGTNFPARADGLAFDSHGNLLIGERGVPDTKSGAKAARVLAVPVSPGTFYNQKMTAGHVYALAGYEHGISYSGDDGPALKAGLGVAIANVRVDAAGNILVSDEDTGRVRVIAKSTGTFYGQPMTARDIYTLAGGGTSLADGVPATSAELDPFDASADAAGNLVIADASHSEIRVVAESTGTFYGQPMTTGDIYTVAGDGASGVAGDGGPATQARLYDPMSVAVDAAGNLAIPSFSNGRLRVVAVHTGTFYGQKMTAGDIYKVAGNGPYFLTYPYSGDGRAATTAQLDGPDAVVADKAGNVLVADYNNERIRVVAKSTGTLYGVPVTAGDIYTVAGGGKSQASGIPATKAELLQPTGIAVDNAGNLLIGDRGHYLLRAVAASSGTFYGQAMTAGNIYTVAGGGTSLANGVPATKAEVRPFDVTVDSSGNLVIADSASNKIRVIAESGGTFYGQPMAAGDIYSVAGNGATGFSGDGGPATQAKLKNPEGVAVDGAGNIVISDSLNFRVRVVAGSTGTFYGVPMTAGHIYTVAGHGGGSSSQYGIPATKATLFYPAGIVVDGAGNLVFDDVDTDHVLVVAESSGMFYGVPMTKGDIYIMAGPGQNGFLGDGGPAAGASISTALGVGIDGTGILIADSGDDRVRLVS